MSPMNERRAGNPVTSNRNFVSPVWAVHGTNLNEIFIKKPSTEDLNNRFGFEVAMP
jgi:hypothetical protein